MDGNGARHGLPRAAQRGMRSQRQRSGSVEGERQREGAAVRYRVERTSGGLSEWMGRGMRPRGLDACIAALSGVPLLCRLRLCGGSVGVARRLRAVVCCLLLQCACQCGPVHVLRRWQGTLRKLDVLEQVGHKRGGLAAGGGGGRLGRPSGRLGTAGRRHVDVVGGVDGRCELQRVGPLQSVARLALSCDVSVRRPVALSAAAHGLVRVWSGGATAAPPSTAPSSTGPTSASSSTPTSSRGARAVG